MQASDAKPELFKVNDLKTYSQWFSLMEDYGHIWFYLDDTYYFLFPLGAHKYGLCLGEDEANGNQPRWTFDSEDEFINSPMFEGKTVLERSDDIMSWEPPYFTDSGGGGKHV